MSTEWKMGLFGCFKDVRLCVVTCFVPCYTVGRIAEHFGEDCMLWGFLACIGLNPSMVLRWRLREEKKLKGSLLMDVVTHSLVPCCALIQEAHELGHGVGTVQQELNRQ